MDRLVCGERERNQRFAVLNAVTDRFGESGVGVPELRRLAGHPEAGCDCLRPLLAVDEKIAVAVAELAVNEEDVAVGLPAGKAEIGADADLPQRSLDVPDG